MSEQNEEPSPVQKSPKKRGPKGPRLSASELKDPRTIRMDEERWNWCLSQEPDASGYLRGLVDRDREKQRRKTKA
jgi:hypothetical protein